jgi:hypothetical protein
MLELDGLQQRLADEFFIRGEDAEGNMHQVTLCL